MGLRVTVLNLLMCVSVMPTLVEKITCTEHYYSISVLNRLEAVQMLKSTGQTRKHDHEWFIVNTQGTLTNHSGYALGAN